MVLGKKVAIFDWEWGQNSAPRDGQKGHGLPRPLGPGMAILVIEFVHEDSHTA